MPRWLPVTNSGRADHPRAFPNPATAHRAFRRPHPTADHRSRVGQHQGRREPDDGQRHGRRVGHLAHRQRLTTGPSTPKPAQSCYTAPATMGPASARSFPQPVVSHSPWFQEGECDNVPATQRFRRRVAIPARPFTPAHPGGRRFRERLRRRRPDRGRPVPPPPPPKPSPKRSTSLVHRSLLMRATARARPSG